MTAITSGRHEQAQCVPQDQVEVHQDLRITAVQPSELIPSDVPLRGQPAGVWRGNDRGENR